MTQTQAQKDAAKEKREAKKLAKQEAEKQAQLDAEQSESEGGEVQQYTPPNDNGPEEMPPVPAEGTHFCSRFKNYRHRGFQFENYRLRILDKKKADALMEVKAFGTDFWLCNKAG